MADSPIYTSRSNTLLPTFGNALFYAQSTPEDWALCVHPQGWIYFYNAKLRVVTDHDIREPEGLELVRRNIANYPIQQLEDDMEVYLHIQGKEDMKGLLLFSLVINHRHSIASTTLEDILDDAIPSYDPERQNRARRLYWNYLWNHPTHIPTPPEALKSAADALAWFHTDNLISGARSIAPFSKAECNELSDILRDFSQPYHENSISKTVFLAWFLREVCSYRNAESYGIYTYKESQKIKQARVHSFKPPVSLEQTNATARILLSLVINCFFFGIPRTYWVHIKSTSELRGRLSDVQKSWDNYVERLVREYSHFLLISTVLLSATVGFLSINPISDGARLAATVSALTSMSSMIIGVFSIWRHQTNTSTKHSYTYMYNIHHSAFGIPGHAILLSLPPVLLVWALVGFTVAILAYGASSATDTDVWGRISAGTLLAIFTGLLTAVLLALYTFSIIWSFRRRKGRYWGRMLAQFRTKLRTRAVEAV